MQKPRGSPFAALAALTLQLGLSVGCAQSSPPPQSPRQTLDAYAAALDQGRARDAYALLSDEAKKSIPFEAFERMVQENAEDARAIADALRRPASPPRVTATVIVPDGTTLLLLYEDGKWKVDGSAIDLYSQKTPKSAVQAFIRAYQNKRYDVLMRFVPESKRQGLTEAKLKTAFEGEQHDEMENLTQALQAEFDTARVETLGDRATFTCSGRALELIREHGVWKIEEFH